MARIKNVLICGLGGVGCVCASEIINSNYGTLRILVDKSRFNKYKKTPTYFNGNEYKFDIIMPDSTNYKADLIIIATKNDGLDEAITNIKNFVKEDTIIISLLNGIHSEEKIAKVYGWKNILISFYIGHSCVRNDRKIIRTGNYNIVIGTDKEENKKALNSVIEYFDKVKIQYKISNNIQEDYWQKFLINVGVNQLCSITGLTLNEIRKNPQLVEKLKQIMLEAKHIAEAKGISNTENIYKEAENFLLHELEDANPSMLQDIKNRRKTEVDIFAGTIVELGQQYKIKTPINSEILKTIKEIENKQLSN